MSKKVEKSSDVHTKFIPTNGSKSTGATVQLIAISTSNKEMMS